MRFFAAILVLFVACGGGGGDAADRKQRQTCSAEGMASPREPDDVPAEAERMRSKVIEAARSCDYAELERLALDASPTFNYSFGEANERPDASPGDYWKEQEDRGEPSLRVLVRLFGLPFSVTTIDERTYVWPSVAGEAPSDDDWTAVEREFGMDTVAQWRTSEGYLGPRIGITTAGDWIFYVAGD